MPGHPYMADASYAAVMGYAVQPAQDYSTGPSHGSFVVWLLVFALASIMLLGGLKVGGFSFVFKTK